MHEYNTLMKTLGQISFLFPLWWIVKYGWVYSIPEERFHFQGDETYTLWPYKEGKLAWLCFLCQGNENDSLQLIIFITENNILDSTRKLDKITWGTIMTYVLWWIVILYLHNVGTIYIYWIIRILNKKQIKAVPLIRFK